MRAPVGLTGHATLADQHEDGQKHAFGGNNQRQDAEWKWIKHLDSRNHAEIDQYPAKNQDQLHLQEDRIADKFCNYLADSLREAPAFKRVMFELGDCSDVVLGGIRSRSGWH